MIPFRQLIWLKKAAVDVLKSIHSRFYCIGHVPALFYATTVTVSSSNTRTFVGQPSMHFLQDVHLL